jgi:hypothetical protein
MLRSGYDNNYIYEVNKTGRYKLHIVVPLMVYYILYKAKSLFGYDMTSYVGTSTSTVLYAQNT